MFTHTIRWMRNRSGTCRRLLHTFAVPILIATAPSSSMAAEAKINLVQGSAGMVWMPVLVARQLNYFSAEGLDVNYIITGGGAKSMAALVTGAADFAATTMTDAINARKQGADVRVVAALLR